MNRTKRNTLTIKDFLRLSETSEVVQAVILDQLKYDTVNIIGNRNLFGIDFLKSSTFKTFCEKLEVSVTTLIWTGRKFDSYWKEIHLKSLRTLIIRHRKSRLSQIPIELYKDSQLEKVIFGDVNISISKYSFTKNFAFADLLKRFETLKILIFDCKIPLQTNAINELFGSLNYDQFQMHEVFFDCYPLPSWDDYENQCFVIEKVELEFFRKDAKSKVIVKPLKIRDSPDMCEQPCQVEHQAFKSKSVTELSISKFEMKCLKYYQSCFRSFPFIRKFSASIQCPKKFLNLLTTELKHSNMMNLKVCFGTMNDEVLEQFLKSFPELRHLDVEIRDESFIYDKCVDLIAKHLEDIETLRIKCDKSYLTNSGLNIIGSDLKSLRGLTIFCTAADTDIKQLFFKLPHLEKVQFNKKMIKRDDFLAHITAANMLPQNVAGLLPSEILEKIFLNLGYNDQLTCRMVCKSWFNSFQLSTKIYLTLHFKSCYLYEDADFVKIIAHTKSRYNRLFFWENANFLPNENLKDLWDQIGPGIKEIYVIGKTTSIIMAFKSGLSLSHLCKLESLVFDTFQSYDPELVEDKPEWASLLCQITKLTLYSYVDLLNQRLQLHFPKLEELRIRDNSQQILDRLNNCNFPNISKMFYITKKTLNMTLLLEACPNFSQLRCLFVAKPIKWSNYELNLITSYCPKLNSLGLCYRTSETNISTFHNMDEILEEFSCKSVAEKMFQELPCLREIYFVIFSTFGEGGEKSLRYSWSDNKLVESNGFDLLFSDFIESCVGK